MIEMCSARLVQGHPKLCLLHIAHSAHFSRPFFTPSGSSPFRHGQCEHVAHLSSSSHGADLRLPCMTPLSLSRQYYHFPIPATSTSQSRAREEDNATPALPATSTSQEQSRLGVPAACTILEASSIYGSIC